MEPMDAVTRLKHVAAARLEKLRIRAKALRAIRALSHLEDITLRYHGACADRNRYEHASQREVDEVRGRIQSVTAAVSHARGGATVAAEPQHIIESGEAELVGLERELSDKLVDRVDILEPLSKRAESLSTGRDLAARAVSEAMADLGVAAMELTGLIDLADLPGLTEMLGSIRPSMREKRADTLHQCAIFEIARAEADLARVGQSAEFDRVLNDLINAELGHQSSRWAEIAQTKFTENTLRALSAAQRALDGEIKKLPGAGQAAMELGNSEPSRVSVPEALSRSVAPVAQSEMHA